MITLLAPALALALCVVGFAALALAMERHQRQVWQQTRLPGRIPLRLVGTGALGAALAACVVHAGWATGLVLWTGLLSGAGLAVALVMSYRPRLFATLLWCGGAAGHCRPALLLGALAVALSVPVFVGIPAMPDPALGGMAIASAPETAADTANALGRSDLPAPPALPSLPDVLIEVPADAQVDAPAGGDAPGYAVPPVTPPVIPPVIPPVTPASGRDGRASGAAVADAAVTRSPVLAVTSTDAAQVGVGQAAVGQGTPGLFRDYVARLQARLAAPSAHRLPGRPPHPADTVLVHLVIGRDGTLLDRQLAQGSGDWGRDATALERVRLAQPLPPLPAGLGQEYLALVLPVPVSRPTTAWHRGSLRVPPRWDMRPRYPAPWPTGPILDPSVRP